MWTYYGAKGNVANLYPQPKHDKIIEPFAGTGRYSLIYFDRDVLLVDKYEVIIRIWKWLQKCSPKDILGLPRLKENELVSNFNLDCEEAYLLMGFLCGKGLEAPRNKPTARATTLRPNNINFQLNFIADSLFKIRHWKIELGDYRDIPNQTATWFIDPPYQFGGYVYKENNSGWDYSELSNWCKSRLGQVMVCENTKANWLPFWPIKTQKGSIRKTTEAVWMNDLHQESLFSGLSNDSSLV